MFNNRQLDKSHYDSLQKKTIAVLIPCYNEGKAIKKVVLDANKLISINNYEVRVYVYDNNSTDNTIAEAIAAGAIVKSEYKQGKGNVVRSMFSNIDADIYLMIDGDGTYDLSKANELIDLLLKDDLDMVIGSRVEQTKTAHRTGHKFGNYIFNLSLKILFNSKYNDIFSGYRIFSKRFVKSFPASSNGFDIETELSVFALNLKLNTKEVKTNFFDRIEGTQSKLSTFKDGFRIILKMLSLFKNFRPFLLFSIIGFICFISALLLGIPIVETYYKTGLVPRIPTALVCVGLSIISFISLACGLILDGIANQRREIMRLFYLQQSK